MVGEAQVRLVSLAEGNVPFQPKPIVVFFFRLNSLQAKLLERSKRLYELMHIFK